MLRIVEIEKANKNLILYFGFLVKLKLFILSYSIDRFIKVSVL